MRTARIALFGIALVFVLTGWPIDGLRPARADDLAKEFVSPPPKPGRGSIGSGPTATSPGKASPPTWRR